MVGQCKTCTGDQIFLTEKGLMTIIGGTIVDLSRRVGDRGWVADW